MSIKSLFINDDENSEKPKKVETSQPLKPSGSVQFPKNDETNSSNSIFNFGFGSKPSAPEVKTIPTGSFSQEHFQKALQVYIDGFDSLNQAG